MLKEDGLAKPSYPNDWKGKNGLYCAGLARRGLYGAAMDAQNISHDIKTYIENWDNLGCEIPFIVLTIVNHLFLVRDFPLFRKKRKKRMETTSPWHFLCISRSMCDYALMLYCYTFCSTNVRFYVVVIRKVGYFWK